MSETPSWPSAPAQPQVPAQAQHDKPVTPAPFGGQQPDGAVPPPVAEQPAQQFGGQPQQQFGGQPQQQFGGQPQQQFGGQPQQQFGGQPQQQFGGQPQFAAQPGALSESDERLWATLAHAGGILFGFLAPLIVWLVQKGKGQFVEDQAKEALNFQILMVIVSVACAILSTVIAFVGVWVPLWGLPWLAVLVFGIMGAMAANRGEYYRYPLNLRLIK